MMTREECAQRRETVVYLTRHGVSARDIADRLGVSARTVVRHRSAAGCVRPYATRLTPSEIERARKLLDDGCSYGEAARTIGRSREAIIRNLPGYEIWDKARVAQAAYWGRELARLKRTENRRSA